METIHYRFDLNTGRCLDECPHGVIGESGDVPFVGSVYCREICKYNGKTPDDGSPVMCRYDELLKGAN